MPELYCSLAETSLLLSAEDGKLLNLLELMLLPLRASGQISSGFRCEVRFGVPKQIPADALVYFEGASPLADGLCILGESDDQRFIVFPERLSVTASLSDRRASVVVRSDEDVALIEVSIMHLLAWVLEADGKMLLHGAAFADPTGVQGVLVFGPSGSGKTTLSLALLKAGFHLYSDDLAVLAQKDGRSLLGGLMRSPKVHRETAALMPWLRDYLGGTWDENGEQVIDGDAAAKIGKFKVKPIPLAAIVRLAGRGREDHSLQPISSSEMLISLSNENIRTSLAGIPKFQRRTFRRLGEIVASVPTYDLFIGRNLASVPPLLAGALSRIAAEGPTKTASTAVRL